MSLTTPAAASPQTVSIWQSGRLVPVAPRARFEPRRAHWIGAGLLVLAAVEMALYVAVLERDLGHAAIARARAYEQAVAIGRCDVKWGAARADCLAQASGAPVLAADDEAPPPNEVYEGAGSSRVSAAMVAGLH